MSCDSQCSVARPHGAVGWSAMCNFGIFLIILTCFFSLYLGDNCTLPDTAFTHVCIVSIKRTSVSSALK